MKTLGETKISLAPPENREDLLLCWQGLYWLLFLLLALASVPAASHKTQSPSGRGPPITAAQLVLCAKPGASQTPLELSDAKMNSNRGQGPNYTTARETTTCARAWRVPGLK